MTKTLNEYFKNLKNPKHLDDLQQLWAFVREQLPDAEEDMRYGMPSYAQKDEVVVTLASQRHYMSLYMDMELVEGYRDRLGGLDCGKSCIRFKHLDDLPLDVIAAILHQTVARQAELRQS